MLGRTIRQAEANKLDESALMAFSLALDQAQLAISDRRSTLTAAAIARARRGSGRREPAARASANASRHQADT